MTEPKDKASIAPQNLDSKCRPAFKFSHEAMRGILILLVILDHNDVIRNVRSVNSWFLPMTFHVAGFLVLPFLTTPKYLSIDMVRTHAVRYLVPFGLALVGYALAFQLVFQHAAPSLNWVWRILVAAVYADPGSLQTSTGFIVLWFLPALLSTVILDAWFHSASSFVRAVVLIATLTIHFTVGALSLDIKEAVPQGMLIAAYIFPFGLLIRHGLSWIRERLGHTWTITTSAALLCLCWAFERGIEVEIATLTLPTLAQPLQVIATDLSNLSFLVLLATCSSYLARVPGLLLVGRYSLLIYLFHPILYKLIFELMLPYYRVSLLNTLQGCVVYWSGAAFSVGLVTAMSLAAAMAVRTSPWLSSFITPRTLMEWPPIAFFGPRL